MSNEIHSTPPDLHLCDFSASNGGHMLHINCRSNDETWRTDCVPVSYLAGSRVEHFTDCTFLFIKVALSHTLDTQNAQWFQHLHIWGCLAFERVGFHGILDFSIIHWLSSHELGLFPCPPFWSTSSGGNHPAAPWLVGLPGWCGMASRDPKIGMLIKAIWFGEKISSVFITTYNDRLFTSVTVSLTPHTRFALRMGCQVLTSWNAPFTLVA